MLSLAASGVFLLSCQGNQQENAQEQTAQQPQAGNTQPGKAVFKQETANTYYAHYQHVQQALVAAHQDEVQQAAEALLQSLADTPEASQASLDAKAVAEAPDLEKQRQAFIALSESITTLVKSAELESGALYLAFCPMANNNKGARWLSSEKEIRNPYFGDKMLKCGEIEETIQ